MTVEDAIEALAAATRRGLFGTILPDAWAGSFVENVAEYTRRGKPLSTEQSRIALKLLVRARAHLRPSLTDQQIDTLLLSPSYRQTPYPSANVPREVRYLGDNLLGFRFKRNDTILDDLKELRRGLSFGLDEQWYVPEYRLWVVPVSRETLEGVMLVIRDHRFSFDDAVATYLTEASNATGVRPSFDADAEVGLIVGRVYDNEIVAWWIKDVLGGSPL